MVGNPPWLELNPGHLDDVERPVFDWIQRNRDARPIGGNQVAEAFAWRSLDLLGAGGCAALVVPAMTLFKYESEHFRKRFFESTRVWSVANFANFAEVLFGGRSRLPAAALFYSPHEPAEMISSSVEVYSPLLANQPVNDSGRIRRRRQTWSIVVNTSEIREIPYREIVSGAALPWKIAMWGSDLDRRLLAKVSRSFRTLADLEAAGQIVLSQGLELRTTVQAAAERTEHHPELAGVKTLDVPHLKNARYLLRFPESSVVRIAPDETHVRKGRFARGMSVARPPHALVGAARTFAVYSEEFLVVPARQIGIVSTSDNRSFLKTIALYLNSDFVSYHQFLTTTQAGIQKTLSTLRALRSLPIPFDATGRLTEWEAFYARLGTETSGTDSFDREDLIRELNQRTFDALRLDGLERAAVSDLVNVRLSLIQGKLGAAAVSPPSRADMDEYARALRDELDAFIGQEVPSRHLVRVVFDQLSGCISVSVVDGTVGKQAVAIVHADADTAQELAEIRTGLREKRAQWVYFNRNLRIYKGSAIYVLKPLQRLHWTVTQAVQDAGEIIAETVRPSAENMERIAG